MKNTKDYVGNTAVEKIIAYMNANYDDTFEYVKTAGGGSIGAKETNIIMNSEKFPSEEIWGYYHPDGGDKMFLDNYILIKYRQQSDEKIKVALKELFGEAELIFEGHTGSVRFSRHYMRDFSFEEYISYDNNLASFSVIVDSSYTVENQSDFEKAFSKVFSDISSRCTVVFAADQHLFDRLKNGEITEYEYFRWIRVSCAEPEASAIEHKGVWLHTYTTSEDEFEWGIFK